VNNQNYKGFSQPHKNEDMNNLFTLCAPRICSTQQKVAQLISTIPHRHSNSHVYISVVPATRQNLVGRERIKRRHFIYFYKQKDMRDASKTIKSIYARRSTWIRPP
jgi:hypothetical protein